ncbi:RNA-binding protein 25-like [Hemicordylus capensis]|uniref:RNA-binding protein 25-like n=1 Tax=Hemicordylus capensis TaxID=884348 RepID=UPI002302F069|nr:RNA-binding protein 25-like [Hemicordylus capensis]
MDADASAPASSPMPAIVQDTLANGDQRTPLESWRQTEAANNPLQLEVVAQEKEKSDHVKEKEQRSTKQPPEASNDAEKMRLDFELAVLKHQQEENEKQRQHEEKMEHFRLQSPFRTPTRGEEEPLGGKLDPITEIELEKMRMEFEVAKLKHISEENERQRQHEWKVYEDKEKQRQHEEKLEQMRLRQGSFRRQKAPGDNADATAMVFSEEGKMRIELQLAMQVYLPEINEKNPPSELSGQQQSSMTEKQVEKKHEARKLPDLSVQQENDGATKHLGMQVPPIVVSAAEPEWSSSRLDLAIETELEKRRMEFELTRLKYEHEENERQRQHEEKMEQLRQQAPPKESE